MKAIEMNGLTRTYGETCAVDHVDLAVEPGETFGYLGPNGAGKTTTIRMLTGLIRPTAGSARIMGLDVAREPLAVKARVGVVPERPNLYGEMSARDNLVFIAQLYGLPRNARRPRADELLARFELADRDETPFRALSGGMKRRLTIAAALVHRPAVLFLDEPTQGLDVRSAHGLRAVISQLRADGVTIFLTTHLLADAERLCDRVAILVKGRLVAVDTPKGLSSRCQDARWIELTAGPAPAAARQAFAKSLAALPVVASIRQQGNTWRLGVTSVHAALAQVVPLAHTHGVEIEAIHSDTVSLEEAFVQITGIDVATLQSNARGRAGGEGR